MTDLKVIAAQIAVREHWIKVLASDTYLLGRGLLNQGLNQGKVRRFCILGVLCDLAVKAEVIPEPLIASDGHAIYVGGAENRLPVAVLRWAGVPASLEFLPTVLTQHELAVFGYPIMRKVYGAGSLLIPLILLNDHAQGVLAHSQLVPPLWRFHQRLIEMSRFG